MNQSPSFFRRPQLAAFALAVGFALVGPTGQVWAQGTASNARVLDSADEKFVAEAAQGGMAEVAMGELAQQRASNAEVKTFGERMVRDHGKANNDLIQVANVKGVALPSTLGVHQAHWDGLRKLSGAEFDRAYMKHMVDDHHKDVAKFEKAAQSAKDVDVKDFAARTLPTLKSHRELAQKTYSQVK